MRADWQHNGSTDGIPPTVAPGSNPSDGHFPSASEWLTVAQVAAALTLSEKTVRELIMKGQIPAAEKVAMDSSGSAEWRVPAAWVNAQRAQPLTAIPEDVSPSPPESVEQRASDARKPENLQTALESLRQQLKKSEQTVTEGQTSLALHKRLAGKRSLSQKATHRSERKRERTRKEVAVARLLAERKRDGAKTEALTAALMSEKDARIEDLLTQIDNLTAQLKGEQLANAEMRWLVSQVVRALPDHREQKDQLETASEQELPPPRRAWWAFWRRPKR